MRWVRYMLRVILFSVLILFSVSVYSEPVNINTANVEQLAENLKGIGPKKAQAIIDYREQNGPFFSADELINVKGIGPKTLEKNRENISVRN